MGREVPFHLDEKCDECGATGVFDFMGDYMCGACASKVIPCGRCGKVADACECNTEKKSRQHDHRMARKLSK